MNDAWKEKIADSVGKNEIMVYMRGTPDAPRCGFSARVLRVLKDLGRPYSTEDMDSDPELWSTLKALNNWPTSPQIYVKGEFVGGCDIFTEMYRSGELHSLLGVEKTEAH